MKTQNIKIKRAQLHPTEIRQNQADVFISSIVFIFCLLYRLIWGRRSDTSIKKQKSEELISTCDSEDESDDNEFVESKKEATRHKSQAIRGM